MLIVQTLKNRHAQKTWNTTTPVGKALLFLGRGVCAFAGILLFAAVGVLQAEDRVGARD
jgi:hypothetical protein